MANKQFYRSGPSDKYKGTFLENSTIGLLAFTGTYEIKNPAKNKYKDIAFTTKTSIKIKNMKIFIKSTELFSHLH